MTKQTKASLSLLSLIMGVGFAAISAQAQTVADRLQVYAGPQTVSPGHNISVTIEMTDVHGKSSHDETVQLIYMSDGKPTSRSGNILNGLASFDVPAQRRAGRMTFKASWGDLESNKAPVLIVAAQPNAFRLKVEPSRNANLVEFKTETIRDVFGNPISDQTLVALDWMDRTGVKRSETAQLSYGRITYVSICPDTFVAPLKVRAVLKNVEIFSSELSVLCAGLKDRT